MTDQAQVFTGAGIDAYQATVIASALTYFARTNVPINRAYTPKNMMAAAEKITGQKFKRSDYLGAAKALREHAAKLVPGVQQND
jgi:hypothetical protein